MAVGITSKAAMCNYPWIRSTLPQAAKVAASLPRWKSWGQAGAGGKCVRPEAGDAARDRHARQGGAVGERIVPDAGDAARDRHARQGGAVVERARPDAGDRMGGSPEHVWDSHSAARTVVAGNRDGTAIVGVDIVPGGQGPGAGRREQEAETYQPANMGVNVVFHKKFGQGTRAESGWAGAAVAQRASRTTSARPTRQRSDRAPGVRPPSGAYRPGRPAIDWRTRGAGRFPKSSLGAQQQTVRAEEAQSPSTATREVSFTQTIKTIGYYFYTYIKY